jgi:hypothetical protein
MMGMDTKRDDVMKRVAAAADRDPDDRVVVDGTTEVERILFKEIEILQRVCAEAYQFAGAVGAPERVLDNLLAAATGRELPHESFLPVTADECERV